MERQNSFCVDFWRLWSWLAILFCSFSLWACGMKTYPQPLVTESLPKIEDLSCQVRGKTVELSWSVPEEIKSTEEGHKYRLAVMKSEVQWENRNCLTCPPLSQQQVQILDPVHPTPAVQTGNRLTWTDGVTTVNRAYRYQIVVKDSKKHVISQSNPVVAKIIAPPPPVSNLSAVTEPRGILLSWRCAAPKAGASSTGDPEIQFVVERRSTENEWSQLGTLPIKGNSFLDAAVASEHSYDYRVTPAYLFEGSLVLGESAVFRQAKAPGALPPPPPATVWVIPVKGALEVHWLKSEGKVGGYHVYRREGKEIIRLTANPLQNPPYVDRSVRKNVVYFYAVSAVSSQAEAQEGLLSKWAEIRSLLLE